MANLLSPLVRLPVSLLLLVLLGVSILFIKNDITTAWRQDQNQESRYLRSPNCFSHQDPSEIDASLPPCRNITVTVIAKPQNTTTDHRRYHDYQRIHYLLTLRDSTGKTQTVGDIRQEMWNSIRIGDQISAQIWEGRIQQVDADGYSESIDDMTGWNRCVALIWPWMILGLICSTCFCYIWGIWIRWRFWLPM